ncbi:MAG: acyl-CoA thioesterase, partial [Melioribacteraceae bacterium]|nr:acyl-CoA thioesterase [Melioribacteraceae bacterium]
MDRAQKKIVKDSIVTMTELVLPQHTNQLGNLLGGQLMHWIDICAALSASKHSGVVCVTASVDNIDFKEPIKLGDVVTLKASVNRAFNTSVEVGVKVIAQNYTKAKKIHTNSAYLTFVGVDEQGKPVKTFEIIPETDEEKRRYKE